MDIENLFLKSVDEWSVNECDERIEKAIEAYEEWIKNLNDPQKQQLGKLIEKFHYYTAARVNEILYELHKETVNRYSISNVDTVVSVVRKKNGMLGSSSDYWLRYQFMSGMSRKIFYDALDEIPANEWAAISKVVFIDDCSGSGETFTKFLGRQKQNFNGKIIILITIEMMEEAKTHIENYATINGLNIQIVYYNLQEKALKTFSQNEVDMFEEVSKGRKISSAYIKGFNFTESLMAFYNNTPNNTLGIFWYETRENCPIFPRRVEEEAGWKNCNYDKKHRSKQQYNAKVAKNNEL